MRTHVKHIIDVSIATCTPDAHDSTHNIRIVRILVSDDVSLLFSSAAASLDIVCEVYLTKVHKPNTRCTSSKSLNEIYGFRPLGNSPFALLSAFEFLQHWDADAISYPSGKNRRTEWTEAGKYQRLKLKEECGDRTGLYRRKLQDYQWKPGTHYEVKTPTADDDYFVFPDIPELHVFRHQWIIVRRCRPAVPCLVGSRPTPYTEAESDGKYFSLFFRPWTLVRAEVDIPHLSSLGRSYTGGGKDATMHDPSAYKHRRCNGKQSLVQNAHNTVQRISYTRSWAEFIEGNIPSENLAHLISNVLTFKYCRDGAKERVESEDDSDADDHIPRFTCGKQDLRHLLRDGAAQKQLDARTLQLRNGKYCETMAVCDALWKPDPWTLENETFGTLRGFMYETEVLEHLQKVRDK